MRLVRPILAKDLKDVKTLDTSYSTDHVWQMEQKSVGEEVSTTFRPIRLPRTIKVDARQDIWPEEWQASDLFVVAEEDREVVGYLRLEVDKSQNVGRIDRLAIKPKKRRQGFGTALIQEAKRWSKVRGVRALSAETQTKNYPAISFFQKSAFSYCGFNDGYYGNKDITIFLICNIN